MTLYLRGESQKRLPLYLSGPSDTRLLTGLDYTQSFRPVTSLLLGIPHTTSTGRLTVLGGRKEVSPLNSHLRRPIGPWCKGQEETYVHTSTLIFCHLTGNRLFPYSHTTSRRNVWIWVGSDNVFFPYLKNKNFYDSKPP